MSQAPDVVVTEARPHADRWRAISERANTQTPDEEEDAACIGVRDGFEEAVQLIDMMTGGDGEYRFSQIPERNSPTPVEMIDGIVARLSTQSARETLETIITWGDQTFGPCSQDRAIERASEEWSEMEEDGADVPIEAADVIICLLRIPGILDAINRKMAINRGRTWDVRPDGTGYHVKSATLSNIGGSGTKGQGA